MMLKSDMRTTITLDADVAALIEKSMRERRLTFKQVVNGAIRSALASGDSSPFATPTFDMGGPTVDLDHALTLAGSLEDAELVRKLDR
jgi:hypothetical protein